MRHIALKIARHLALKITGLTGFVADRRLIIWRHTFEPISDYDLR